MKTELKEKVMGFNSALTGEFIQQIEINGNRKSSHKFENLHGVEWAIIECDRKINKCKNAVATKRDKEKLLHDLPKWEKLYNICKPRIEKYKFIPYNFMGNLDFLFQKFEIMKTKLYYESNKQKTLEWKRHLGTNIFNKWTSKTEMWSDLGEDVDIQSLAEEYLLENSIEVQLETEAKRQEGRLRVIKECEEHIRIRKDKNKTTKIYLNIKNKNQKEYNYSNHGVLL